MAGQSVLEYRVLRLERDQVVIRTEMRENKAELLKAAADQKNELLAAIQGQNTGMGKFFDRAIMVLVGLIALASLIVTMTKGVHS